MSEFNHPSLEVIGLSKHFGSHVVLHDVNLTIYAGQIAALVGPSGCGKSTLLKAILGTHLPTSGKVLAHGRPVLGPGRDVGIVHQDYPLYSFLSARENVAFGLMLDESTLYERIITPWRWWPKKKRHLEIAQAMLDRVHLAHAGDLYPHEMSGGMRQRVAIAQSLVMKPSILLLDEPFGALDEATRQSLQIMLLDLYQDNLKAKQNNQPPPITILIVTHELHEAIYVGDRIIGLSQYHGQDFPGATIVLDRPAPIFHPGNPSSTVEVEQLKDIIRKAVFDPEEEANHESYVQAWDNSILSEHEVEPA